MNENLENEHQAKDLAVDEVRSELFGLLMDVPSRSIAVSPYDLYVRAHNGILAEHKNWRHDYYKPRSHALSLASQITDAWADMIMVSGLGMVMRTKKDDSSLIAPHARWAYGQIREVNRALMRGALPTDLEGTDWNLARRQEPVYLTSTPDFSFVAEHFILKDLYVSLREKNLRAAYKLVRLMKHAYDSFVRAGTDVVNRFWDIDGNDGRSFIVQLWDLERGENFSSVAFNPVDLEKDWVLRESSEDDVIDGDSTTVRLMAIFAKVYSLFNVHTGQDNLLGEWVLDTGARAGVRPFAVVSASAFIDKERDELQRMILGRPKWSARRRSRSLAELDTLLRTLRVSLDASILHVAVTGFDIPDMNDLESDYLEDVIRMNVDEIAYWNDNYANDVRLPTCQKLGLLVMQALGRQSDLIFGSEMVTRTTCLGRLKEFMLSGKHVDDPSENVYDAKGTFIHELLAYSFSDLCAAVEGNEYTVQSYKSILNNPSADIYANIQREWEEAELQDDDLDGGPY